MEKYICKIIILSLLWSFNITAQDFVWIAGNQGINGVGNYGTQGIPASTNYPGSRKGGATWTDSGGNLWLFGGWGVASGAAIGYLSDLWKYNVSTNKWIWVSGGNQVDQLGIYGTKGQQSSGVQPGGRTNAVSWTDASGNLWLFGGDGASSGNYGFENDIWKYNISANQWTWMKGSGVADASTILGTIGVPSASATPGARTKSVGWVDASGIFWLYGGLENNGPILYQIAELWKYDPATNEWTWVRDGNLNGSTPTYGTKGVSAPSNYPGSLDSPCGWVDNGNLWLFGGHHTNGISLAEEFSNALWKYNINSNQWTWVSGNPSFNTNSNYGTQGTPSSANIIGARAGSLLWKDANGTPFFSGGFGLGTMGTIAGFLNDLWTYNTATDQWTWLKGSNSLNPVPDYGIQGVAAPTNIPDGKSYPCAWTDGQGNQWMLGGQIFSLPVTMALSYAFWKYNQPCIVPFPPANVTSASNLIICANNSATLNASGTGTLNWYNVPNGGTSLFTGNIFITGNLTADTTYYVDSETCMKSASRTAISVSVVVCNGLSMNQADTKLSIYPNPNSGVFTLEVQREAEITITNMLGQIILKKRMIEGQNEINISPQTNGIYFVKLNQQHRLIKLIKTD